MAKPDLLKSLDAEPGKWKKTGEVILFRAHERKFPDGTTIKVTDDELSFEANRANESIRKGRMPTFTLGHRLFGNIDETKQPTLGGFYKNFQCKKVSVNGESFLAVVGDEYAAKDIALKHDVYRKMPFRSVEYSKSGGIAGVAALQQPPALDLGTVYDYSDGTPAYSYQTDPIPMNDNPPAAAPPAAQPAAPAPGAEQWTAEDAAAYEIFKKYMLKFQAESGGGPAAAPPAPAAAPSDDDKPAEKPADKPGDDDMDNKPYQSVIDAKILEQQQEIAALKARNVETDCRRLLDPIKPYFQFDYDRELALMKTYADDASRAAHVDYIAANHTKLPTGGMIQTYQGAVKPQGAPGGANVIDPMMITPEQHEKIKKYAADHAVTYGDAMAVVCK